MGTSVVRRIIGHFERVIWAGREPEDVPAPVNSVRTLTRGRKDLLLHIFFRSDRVIAAGRADIVRPLRYLLDHISSPTDLLGEGAHLALLDICMKKCQTGPPGVSVDKVLYATKASTQGSISREVRRPSRAEILLIEDLIRRAGSARSVPLLRTAVDLFAHFRMGMPTACVLTDRAGCDDGVLRVRGPYSHPCSGPLRAAERVLLAITKATLDRQLAPLYTLPVDDSVGIIRAMETGYRSAGHYLQVTRPSPLQGNRAAGSYGGACGAVDRMIKFVEDVSHPRECGTVGIRRSQKRLLTMLEAAGVRAHRERFAREWPLASDARLTVGRKTAALRPVCLPWVEELGRWMKAKSGACDVTGLLAAPSAVACPLGAHIEVHEECDLDRICRSQAAVRLFLFPEEPELPAYLLATSRWIPSAYVPGREQQTVRNAQGKVCKVRWGISYRRRWLHNIVAEVLGVEIRDEWVVVGAHLDSFPGTVGAADDAAGCGVLLELARRFALQPARRNLRFVWFTGEELDRCGSRAYVSRHRGELSQHVLYLNIDGGFRLTSTSAQVSADSPSLDLEGWVRQSLGLEAPYVPFKRRPPSTSDAEAFHSAGVLALSLGASRLLPPPRPHLPSDRLERLDLAKMSAIFESALALVDEAANNRIPPCGKRDHDR